MLKNAKRFVETFKNYASYIHTFSLTDNFQNSRKKGKKIQELSFRSSLPEEFDEKVVTVKPINSGHLRVLKDLSVIERSPLLGGNLKKIVTFGT